MNTQKNNSLTPNQFTYMIIGFIVGVGIITLPNDLVAIAEQDSWISVIIAILYPLYIVMFCIYIINKHPKENILILNKKYLGKFLGHILNFILMMQFMLTYILIISNSITLCREFIVSYLTPLKVAIILIGLATYSAYKGLRQLGKMNEMIFYMFAIAILFSISALKCGSIMNLQPVFGSGAKSIIRAVPKAAFAYSGWEAILLLFPYLHDVKHVKRCALKAVVICEIIYLWVVFITIFYLGIDIIPKSYWALLLTFESITVPIINNFRYIFMFIWLFLSIRISANYHFAIALVFNDFKKIELKKMCLFIYPLILYLVYKFTDVFLKQKVVTYGYPILVIFNLIAITVLAGLIHFKGKKHNLKNNKNRAE